ncbi:MAG TPA: Gfo/Idh/MocA family oxidoreductase [Bacteroides togonis]|nr:Gfo/Idh/MocA family oxidoreductase [Bacteroides togonis]
MKIKVAIIGFGRMGQMYCKEMQYSGEWDILYICDTNPDAREEARNIVPASTRIVSDEDILFNDPQVEVVGLFTLANSRKEQIEKAVRTHKHIIAEKPIADTQEKELEAVNLTEHSDIFSTVNLYLRNAWYHQAMKQFIQEGEIGELAILRICHMTPGLAPGEGHEHEGPAFHDCGMHYVDIARWYAESDYKTWNAQGIRMWDYKDPWWIQCHGTFHNGVVFDITQGFVYGQLSKDQTHNAYTDIIGTKGIVRMTHDFKTATVELHGVNRTLCLQQPFGGKNLDKLCKQMAASIRSGIRDNRLPSLRDSIEASHYAWSFLEDARHNCLPSIGNLQTLEEIRERRKHMKNGYGLLRPAQ